MLGTITDVLSQKGSNVFAVQPQTTVQAAVDLMATHKIGALVVMERGRPVGLINERDVLWRVVHERLSLETKVAEVMEEDAVTIRPGTRVSEAMRLMTDERVRHLPVVEHERLVGLVSIGDLTKWVTEDLEAHVGELVSYIHGRSVVSASIG